MKMPPIDLGPELRRLVQLSDEASLGRLLVDLVMHCGGDAVALQREEHGWLAHAQGWAGLGDTPLEAMRALLVNLHGRGQKLSKE
jgi:hypothetical protein